MKSRLLLAGFAFALMLCGSVFAQDNAPAPQSAPTEAQKELEALVEKISAKARAQQANAAGLAPELKEFEALMAKYPEKNESGAQIAFMHAMLYVQLLKDTAKGRELLLAVKQNFPGTEPAAAVDQVFEQMDQQARAEAATKALIGKTAPELNFIWSSNGRLKKLSDLKGSVVVLDFWATWCGPCIASFPQIREQVAHYKGSPVVFLGVTSIQGFVANNGPRVKTADDPQKEMALMVDFMKAKDMTWDVVFSQEEVFNPDYGIQGIPFVAIIAPDGTVRHTGLHPGDPGSAVEEKIDALLKEFKLTAPAKAVK